jgi:hypothetical protein
MSDADRCLRVCRDVLILFVPLAGHMKHFAVDLMGRDVLVIVFLMVNV